MCAEGFKKGLVVWRMAYGFWNHRPALAASGIYVSI